MIILHYSPVLSIVQSSPVHSPGFALTRHDEWLLSALILMHVVCTHTHDKNHSTVRPSVMVQSIFSDYNSYMSVFCSLSDSRVYRGIYVPGPLL